MNKPTKAQANARPAQSRPAQGQTAQSGNVQQPADEAGYFNLHTTGCGYLSRVRWVHPNQRRGGRTGDSFLACAINALRGEVSNPNYTYFDLRVSGTDAIDLVEQLKEAVDQNRTVFVAFKLGDTFVHLYDREVFVLDQNGKNVLNQDGRKVVKKEHQACIKGRLLLVTHAKVDGETVYAREDTAAEDRRGDAPPPAAAPAGTGEGEQPGEPGNPEGEGQDEPPEEVARSAVRPGNSGRQPASNGRSVDRTRVRSYAAAHG